MGKSETKKASQSTFGVSAHHVKYLERDGYEVIVNVTKGEHLVLSRLSWYTKKRVSKGVLTALAQFVADNIGRAIDLEKEKP